MNFQVKKLENCRKYILWEMETRKQLLVMFLDVKVLAETVVILLLDSVKNKVGTVYVFTV